MKLGTYLLIKEQRPFWGQEVASKVFITELIPSLTPGYFQCSNECYLYFSGHGSSSLVLPT